MISKIYSYSSQRDVDNASKTCHHWLNAKQLNREHFLKLHLNGSILDSSQYLLKYIVESNRIVSKVSLENIGESKISKNFWKKLNTVALTELKIENCSFSIYELADMLKLLPNLNKIQFIGCKDMFAQLARKRSKFKENFFDCFRKVTSFTIDNLTWRGMKEADFSTMLSSMENLKEFDISLGFKDCFFIIENIKKRNLTSLKLNGYMSEEFYTRVFKEIEHFNLEIFQIGPIEINDVVLTQIMFPSLLQFLSTQTNLRELSIGVSNFGSEQLLLVLRVLTKLEKLQISNSCFFIVIGNELLGYLNKLKCLTVCFKGRNYMDGFFYSKNDALTHFTYRALSNTYGGIADSPGFQLPLHRFTQFKNLTHFDLYHKYICGLDIQFIIKNLRNLEVLRVGTKEHVSFFFLNYTLLRAYFRRNRINLFTVFN